MKRKKCSQENRVLSGMLRSLAIFWMITAVDNAWRERRRKEQFADLTRFKKDSKEANTLKENISKWKWHVHTDKRGRVIESSSRSAYPDRESKLPFLYSTLFLSPLFSFAWIAGITRQKSIQRYQRNSGWQARGVSRITAIGIALSSCGISVHTERTKIGRSFKLSSDCKTIFTNDDPKSEPNIAVVWYFYHVTLRLAKRRVFPCSSLSRWHMKNKIQRKKNK